jgi:hypothetical protein
MPFKNTEDKKNWEKEYRKTYSQRPETKKLWSEKSKLRRERNKKFVIGQMTPCISCGESDPVVIDFHHLDETKKDKGISQMMQSNYSLQKIQEELDKCVCLCSNCHRRVHAGTLTLRV